MARRAEEDAGEEDEEEEIEDNYEEAETRRPSFKTQPSQNNNALSARGTNRTSEISGSQKLGISGFGFQGSFFSYLKSLRIT